MKSRRHVLGGYAVWMAFLTAAYYGLPGLRAEVWGLIGLSAVMAIGAGVVINRPSRKAPWLLFAAALASLTAGQLSFQITAKLNVILAFPSFADVLYLCSYPLYAAGLLILIYWRTPDGDRRSLTDALTLTAGVALLTWTYLITPLVRSPGLSGLQKSVDIAYPLGDVLVLALMARLLAPGRIRDRCVQLLALGAAGWLVSDVVYNSLELYRPPVSGTFVELGWAVFCAASGAAALHPTMTELTQPGTGHHVEDSPVRLTVLTLLMLASLIAPIVLFTESFWSGVHAESVIAVFPAILYLPVLSRLWDVAASHLRALGRERAVRQADVSLLSAATVDQAAFRRCLTVRQSQFRAIRAGG